MASNQRRRRTGNNNRARDPSREPQGENPFLQLPSEILVKIASELETTEDLFNFKQVSRTAKNAIDGVARVRPDSLPHTKVFKMTFHMAQKDRNEVVVKFTDERRATGSARLDRRHIWRSQDPDEAPIDALLRHFKFEDDCVVEFFVRERFNFRLLEGLSLLNYGQNMALNFRLLKQYPESNGVQENLDTLFHRQSAKVLLKQLTNKMQPSKLMIEPERPHYYPLGPDRVQEFWGPILNGLLEQLANLKDLYVLLESECLPDLTHEQLRPLAGQPGILLSVVTPNTGIQINGVVELVEVWKASEPEEPETEWVLTMDRQTNTVELKDALIGHGATFVSEVTLGALYTAYFCRYVRARYANNNNPASSLSLLCFVHDSEP